MLLDYLETNPAIGVKRFCQLAHIPYSVARNILSDLMAMGTICYVLEDKRILYTLSEKQKG